MKNIYLCGHTGSVNRGCEAILRSTAHIFNMVGLPQATALTFDKKYDEALGVNDVLTLVSYPNVFSLVVAIRKLFRKRIKGSKLFYYGLFRRMKSDSVVFNIGGDTYCYGTPFISYALNELAEKNKTPNVFWGCSVDETAASDPEKRRDINRYSRIVVRESLSYEILKKAVDKPEKIIRACDPAFQLPIKETRLPDCFLEGNTLGINVSPLVFTDYKNENDPMRRNVARLIDYAIAETDLNVCLIPHVFNVATNSQDLDVLGRIYQRYADTRRVGLIKEELSCSELKYIISKCRYFIGARTHATIAAYSTAVPTLALSYSIKSRGIAVDLFGTDETFATPWKNFKNEDDLLNLFNDGLVAHENALRKRYEEILPQYKNTIIEAARRLASEL